MTGLDLRWKALASRDGAADGTFVYGVTSTGIYCRPSCPSRRPRADRVRFFDTTHRGAAGGIPRLQALPARHGRPRAARHRCGAPRLGLPRDARRSDRHARSPGARRIDEPASPAAPLQGDRRSVAERISVGGARRKVAHQPARRPRCDDGDLRSRIRIAEPRLRSGADRARACRSRTTVAAARACGSATRRCRVRVGQVLVAATENGVCSVKIGDSETALAARSAARVSGRRHRRQPEAAKRVGQGDRAAPARRCAVARSADRRAGHGVPVESVARAAADSRTARRAPTPRSPGASASRRRSGRWRAPAPPIPCASSSPAIGWCRRPAAPAGTAGEPLARQALLATRATLKRADL